MFPDLFPDKSVAIAELLQEKLLIDLDEILTPDDPLLPTRRESLFETMLERSRPPILTPKHRENMIDRMRGQYTVNRLALTDEGFGITDLTPVKEFWETYQYVQKKYKSNRHGQKER